MGWGKRCFRSPVAARAARLHAGRIYRPVSLVLLVVAGGAAGCRAVDHVNVFPPLCEVIAVGDTVQFSATADAALGWPGILYTSQDRPGKFRWSSSDPNLATVTLRGLVRGIRPGTITIFASTEGVTGNSDVVIISTVRTLEVSPKSARIAVGDSLRVSAVVHDASGAPVQGLCFYPTVEDRSIAFIAGELLVVGLKPGETRITIRGGHREAWVALTVVPR